jgi:hypothetical protein
MTEIIINMKHKNFLPKDKDLIRIAKENKFTYRYHSVVSYNKKFRSENAFEPPALEKSFNDYTPFSLYKSGIPITILQQYMGGKINKSKLSSAREAFKQLKDFATQCCERISADLCCQIILQEVLSRENHQLLIFIEKSASDKMLGRLATLQLDLSNVTICFLTYQPSDLMTIAMSNRTSKLRFDINRLMSAGLVDFIGPYPGDTEESLLQSYFHQPIPRGEGGESFSPMRIDIFSQGLRMDQIEDKKELIKKVFEDSKDSYKDPNDHSELPRLIPTGFDLLDGQLENIREKIEERLY